MLRRELILEEEQRESILLREEATKVTTGIQTKSGPQNVAAWLEQPIKSTTEIEKLLQAQEQAERARSGGAATTSAYSKLFRKERERLEEWRESIQRKGESSLGEEEKAKVKEILSGLEKELLPKPKAAEVKGKLDISKPAATAMDEKASKKKLDSLSNAVEALWQI
ncbi:hypothetical protein DL95DRAFT_397443 [Leptodontidium sp. 2 PMI_412]|nr:hypothetical protein DL95DRAFT_397443 [Leptodontidium sp. 2 PMI_412]